MRRIRTAVAYLGLGLTLLSSLPHPLLADDKTVVASRWSDPGTVPAGFESFDLERCLPTPAPGAAVASRHTFHAAGLSAQASSGWSSYSTSKKTWIIVGIVVGVAAIAVAVSNHGGDDNGGGGGY
ncbi:MAG TPA: hypothetical protein VFB95_03010 [Candidatus Cryosericum sp.]|nr:hypothetical protein [Candidatus Cryosericum sp.]